MQRVRAADAKDGLELDMLHWSARTTLEVFGQAGLGVSFDPLTEDHPDDFAMAVNEFFCVLQICRRCVSVSHLANLPLATMQPSIGPLRGPSRLLSDRSKAWFRILQAVDRRADARRKCTAAQTDLRHHARAVSPNLQRQGGCARERGWGHQAPDWGRP